MSRRFGRKGLPDEVPFPVTPFLDMAFQLLAFFILTFRSPSRETRLDLYLPAAPAALPTAPEGRAKPPIDEDEAEDLDDDLVVRAESDDRGELASLRLGDAAQRDPETLGERLKKYASVLGGRPLRIRLRADDRLRYGVAARIIGACQNAGVTSIRLVELPTSAPRP